MSFELSLYFRDRDERTSLLALVDATLSNGARLSGRAWIHEIATETSAAFSSISDLPRQEVRIRDRAELQRLSTEPGVRLVQVGVFDAAGTGAETHDVLTYQSISESAARIDHHPVALWPCYPEGSPADRLAPPERWRGQLAIAFMGMVSTLVPTYASISVETPLPCPTDIHPDRVSHALYDVYLGPGLRLEPDLQDALIEAGATVGLVGAGTVVSATGLLFGDMPLVLDARQVELGDHVAMLVGRYIRRALGIDQAESGRLRM